MQILSARDLTDFEEANALITEMAEWDAAQSRNFGVSDAELISYIYGQNPQSLMAKFNAPCAGFFLAVIRAEVVGCVGYSRLDGNAAEVQKMYVRPKARGHGLSRALLDACTTGIRRDGYAIARLETVTFMLEAIALYEKFGFRRCAAFREVPKSLKPITIFMEQALSH